MIIKALRASERPPAVHIEIIVKSGAEGALPFRFYIIPHCADEGRPVIECSLEGFAASHNWGLRQSEQMTTYSHSESLKISLLRLLKAF